MIQRIQTIYLFIVVLISGVLGWFLSWFRFDQVTHNLGSLIKSNDIYLLAIGVGFIVVGVLALLSLMRYKNRTFQMRLNRVTILLNILLLGLMVFYLLKLSGESFDSMKGIGIWVPLVSIVFLLLANAAIKKDDNLVKSVDRLR